MPYKLANGELTGGYLNFGIGVAPLWKFTWRAFGVGVFVVCQFLWTAQSHAEPPFWGTIFIDADIITPDDPTTYISLTDSGTASRTMYDRRAGWVTDTPYLFKAQYSDDLTIEIQVNSEFANTDAARVQAAKYAPIIGQLPRALRVDVETVWIHQGTEPFGGGNNNLLIHIGQGDLYIADGILEETFVHEAAHTSLDANHAQSSGWLAAQAADNEFISVYAQDYPLREDIAESFLPYLAIAFKPATISDDLYKTITETIPNRIAYFAGLNLDMSPITNSLGRDSTGDEQANSDTTKDFNEATCSANCFSFDIDQSASLSALTDGLLVIRYLFGFTGYNLVANGLDTSATRKSPTEITQYLRNAETDLDIDGSGDVAALTDGLLLMRYLFGFTGDALIDGAVGANATRTTATEIEAYLQARQPSS